MTEEEKQQMFVDILPELPADDRTARVSFYLEPEEDNPGILARVREELENLRNFTDIGEGNNPFLRNGRCGLDQQLETVF